MPLKEGNSYIFKVRSTYSSMYVWNNVYKEMKKGADGLFTSDKIKYVRIVGKDKYDRILAQYNITSE